MIPGIILLVLTGICWVGIAAVVSMAANKQLDIGATQGLSAIIVLIAAFTMMFFQSPIAGTSAEKIVTCVFVFAAGAGNYAMLKLMRRGMVLGNNGAVWGITQTALVCPFIMGMALFGVEPTIPRILGILLILTGIMLFSRTKPRRRQFSSGWLWVTAGAFLASGLAQCFANLPSYWTQIRMSSELRAGLVQLGTLSLFAITAPFEKKNCVFPES